jgi:hypothetical protein
MGQSFFDSYWGISITFVIGVVCLRLFLKSTDESFVTKTKLLVGGLVGVIMGIVMLIGKLMR